MPGITNPAEEYFKDGVWAWDPAGAEWLKLIIDPLTNRLVIDHPGDIEVVQPVPADLLIGPHGWDGSAWRKLPLIFGLSSSWAESMVETKSGDGTYSKDSGSVPAGEIWVVQAASLLNNTGARGRVHIFLRGASNYLSLGFHAGPAQYEAIMYFGAVVMSVGDCVRMSQAGCLNGDLLLGEVRGYKMKIAE